MTKVVPDYYDVVKQPMDFPTIRKKLRKNCYKSLEDLQADVQLLCSNAMLFNGPDTVYHKQGLAIQILPMKSLENLKMLRVKMKYWTRIMIRRRRRLKKSNFSCSKLCRKADQ
ncbi:uncharacterized protein LOC127240892 [Andrographis paniculata]|uniref:uncharacterized protein LOC127240892 n=1 Tax=Andrographis paniculata TaxID=175694 RepID=UPI0021E7E002|nr:uncharacterized protein LOC127240892 [Andrographis paniculata]